MNNTCVCTQYKFLGVPQKSRDDSLALLASQDCCGNYTRSPLEDSRPFGPSPWKVLATTYGKNDL